MIDHGQFHSGVPAQVLSALTGSSTAAAHARAMGRVMRVVVNAFRCFVSF